MAKRKIRASKYFQFEIPDDEHEGLQRVAQAKGASMSDVVRRLIQLVGMVQYEAGQKIAILDRENKVVVLVAGL